jgi:hypothetical protein
MASSVSSEHAFSSAGITISKCRNRLDTEIVEALQCLKSLPCQDLLLQDVPSVADEEARLDDDNKQHINQVRTASEVVEGQEDCTWEEVPPLAETHSNGGIDDNNN